MTQVLMYPQAKPMAAAPVTSEGLSRMYRTTLLLTGNAEQAEAAILDAIASTDPERVSDQGLFLGAVRAALAPRCEALGRTREPDHLSSVLPRELRSVLHLSMDLRRCFVLRVLAGLSRQECARLLHVDTRIVDESTCAAARELTRIRQLETPAEHAA